MAEIETYVTKENPNEQDWLDFNNNLFASLRGEVPQETPQYAPFVDVDLHAAESGMSVEAYFEQITDKVGPLGRAALRLVHSDMDDAWHIIVAPKKEVQDL